MEEKQPISIVLTCWKREWMTRVCIEALQRNTKTPYRLIVIDNGSDKDFQASYLTGNSDVYIKLDQNYGLEYAKNLGMSFVTSPYFVSIDNDILVYKHDDMDWLARLLLLMAKYPMYAAIAPRPQILVADTMAVFDTKEELVEFPRIPGYARLMNTDAVRRAGAWGDRRPGRGHEEIWIAEKLHAMGYKTGWATKVRCWHLFGKEDTDEWGYPKDMTPEQHGHQPVWPIPKNDLDEIRKGVGIEL